MHKFICEYNILDDYTTRENCLMLFGGMSRQDDINELGNVTLLGRWGVVGEVRGFCIVEAPDCETVQKWLINWVPMANIKVEPCLDDNEQRELILGKEPSYRIVYDKINNDPKEKESLYYVKYKFKEDKVSEGFTVFANMSEQDDTNDSGKCTSYGRWHVPSKGSGCVIASCPSTMDIYKWTNHWQELCECEVFPVTGDSVTRSIISSRPDFEKKRNNLLINLGIITPPSKILSICNTLSCGYLFN